MLIEKAIHLAFVWTTAFCVLVQSVGAAAGGVLCVGCTDLPGGLALASAPCTPINDCCAKHTEHQSSQPDESEDDSDDACGCFDVTLSPTSGTLSQPPAKNTLALAHFAALAAVTVNVPEVAVARPSWGARAGPPIVRLLVPSGRQTVLLI